MSSLVKTLTAVPPYMTTYMYSSLDRAELSCAWNSSHVFKMKFFNCKKGKKIKKEEKKSIVSILELRPPRPELGNWRVSGVPGARPKCKAFPPRSRSAAPRLCMASCRDRVRCFIRWLVAQQYKHGLAAGGREFLPWTSWTIRCARIPIQDFSGCLVSVPAGRASVTAGRPSNHQLPIIKPINFVCFKSPITESEKGCENCERFTAVHRFCYWLLQIIVKVVLDLWIFFDWTVIIVKSFSSHRKVGTAMRV
jgi:hypothetical protein